MAAELVSRWTDDLLIASDVRAVDMHGRRIEVAHVRDARTLQTITVDLDDVGNEGARAARGEFAGRVVVVPNAETAAALEQRASFRAATCVDLLELLDLIFAGGLSPSAPFADAVPLDPPEGLADFARPTWETFVRAFEILVGQDPATLQLVVRLSSGTSWPLHAILVEAERHARLMGALGAASRGGISVAELPAVTYPIADPLPQSGRKEPVDAAEARAALSGGGAVAGQLDHFESRPSQIEMLEAVTRAFNAEEHALVEAGTGTGKSFAYLVPSVLFAARNNRRVCVSTATINLQDQLFLKDVPRVVEALGADVRFAVVKGRANYLCLRRWWQLLNSDGLAEADRTLLIKTIFWLPQTLSGDRAELHLTANEEQAWNRVCALSEACTPLRCQYHRAGVCFIARARRTAEASHIVIINHALLLTDTLNQAHVLPEFDHLVVDEGHHLEDEATSQLGWSVTGRELQRHLDILAGSAGTPGLAREAIQVAQQAGSALQLTYGDIERSIERSHQGVEELVNMLTAFLSRHGEPGDAGLVTLRITDAGREEPEWTHVEQAWDGLARTLNGLGLALSQLGSALEPHAAQREDASELAGQIATEAAFWDLARTQLHRTLSEGGSDPITWLTRARGDEISLSLAPLEVGETLAKCVFQAKSTVVVTSATLTTAGRFDYVRGRVGLQDATELRVPSPFDYATAALVCAPVDLPEPNRPNYQRSVEWVVERVVSRIRGRTLILFTSHSQLRATYEAIQEPLGERGILVLGQGVDAASRDALLQTFRERQPAVLLGTNSFWEGVDVVGETLSCVIIPRLPFSVPTDPVFQARSELFEQPFRDYAVPQAILRFRQGFGRLIRSQRDRGALLILDSRVLSKFYGGMFLRSLPEATLYTGSGRRVAEAIEEWLGAASA